MLAVEQQWKCQSRFGTGSRYSDVELYSLPTRALSEQDLELSTFRPVVNCAPDSADGSSSDNSLVEMIRNLYPIPEEPEGLDDTVTEESRLFTSADVH